MNALGAAVIVILCTPVGWLGMFFCAACIRIALGGQCS